MSQIPSSNGGSDDANERELIDLEFQSLIEGLSLDESAPTSYLDELEKFEVLNKFRAPVPPKVGLRESIKRAFDSWRNWKNGPTNLDGDGAAL